MRVGTLAFGREHDAPPDTDGRIQSLGHARPADGQGVTRRIPAIMTYATAGMVTASVLLTVFAGPLYALCDRIGAGLVEPITLELIEDGAG